MIGISYMYIYVCVLSVFCVYVCVCMHTHAQKGKYIDYAEIHLVQSDACSVSLDHNESLLWLKTMESHLALEVHYYKLNTSTVLN